VVQRAPKPDLIDTARGQGKTKISGKFQIRVRMFRLSFLDRKYPVVQCEIAEELGFEAAWLSDSHMVYSDVYVIMALCAQRTRHHLRAQITRFP
jgi:hypothetical protein